MVHALVCAYNEGPRIYAGEKGPIAAAIKALKQHHFKSLTIVNDGSTDNTKSQILQALKKFNFKQTKNKITKGLELQEFKDAHNKKIILLSHQKNQGKTKAILTGLNYIQKKNKDLSVFFFDADLINFSIDHILKMLEQSKGEKEFMIRGLLDPDIKKFANWANNLFPVFSGLRLISPNIIKNIHHNLKTHHKKLKSYQIELFIEEVIKSLHKSAKTKNIRLKGLGHVNKEKKALQDKDAKYIFRRLKMWTELLRGLRKVKKLKYESIYQ